MSENPSLGKWNRNTPEGVANFQILNVSSGKLKTFQGWQKNSQIIHNRICHYSNDLYRYMWLFIPTCKALPVQSLKFNENGYFQMCILTGLLHRTGSFNYSTPPLLHHLVDNLARIIETFLHFTFSALNFFYHIFFHCTLF